MSSILHDAFEHSSAWQVFASGQARGVIESIEGPYGVPALRLRYDFHGGSGFIALRYPMALSIPRTFRIRMGYRGDGPPNHWECKVASPGGANVWRHRMLDVAWPAEWQAWSFTERELAFAWGPAGGGAPDEVEALEFVIVAGPGGHGHVDLCGLELIDETLARPAMISASSEKKGHPAEDGLEAGSGEWLAQQDDPQPWWCMDFGRMHRFGGLIVEWPAALPPRAFTLEASADGDAWQTLYRAQCADGPRSHIPTPAAESRYLRLCFHNARCAALRAVHVQPDAFSHNTHAFMHAVAKDNPRGWHPRYWHREQSYWTPVGLPEGGKRALINEEGMVEMDEGGFSLEPFAWTPEGLLTWAEMRSELGLVKDALPMPQVTLTHEKMTCEITPWIDDEGGGRVLRVRYRWSFKHDLPQVTLAIAVRPFQVTPPWQTFRNLGGISPIEKVDASGAFLLVNDHAVYAEPAPHELGAALMEQGGVLAYLSQGKRPPGKIIVDPTKLASAAMMWQIPGDTSSWEVTVALPYDMTNESPTGGKISSITRRWQEALDRVKWTVPCVAQAAVDCWKTCAGHILINREGAGFQPGPRRYTRSWMRDSVIMGAALAKTGNIQPLRSFLTWYAGFQREDGFIPCVVDRDGIDWLVEHDSHGQFLWGIREVFRYEKDAAFLIEMLPYASKAADYLRRLRSQHKTDFYLLEEHKAKYGLLPESASHEGYLAHPVHSYWDDFWGIRGLEAHADLCLWSGHGEESVSWRHEAESFQRDVLRSLQAVIDQHHLRHVPGSVEWADFDPTATANAIAMLDFADALPKSAVECMLATYLDGFRRKHSGDMPWNNYTAYEIRIIGAMGRCGKREEARELLEFFLSDRRPVAWNQWPEITWRDPRSPGHLGDVPHTWISAEYMLALTAMVASEREASRSLVLAAGLPWEWIATGQGFAVEGLPTHFGSLDLQLSLSSDDEIILMVAGGLTIPEGGLFLNPPLPRGRAVASMEIRRGACSLLTKDHDSLQIHQLPLLVHLRLESEGENHSSTISRMSS